MSNDNEERPLSVHYDDPPPPFPSWHGYVVPAVLVGFLLLIIMVAILASLSHAS